MANNGEKFSSVAEARMALSFVEKLDLTTEAHRKIVGTFLDSIRGFELDPVITERVADLRAKLKLVIGGESGDESVIVSPRANPDFKEWKKPSSSKGRQVVVERRKPRNHNVRKKPQKKEAKSVNNDE